MNNATRANSSLEPCPVCRVQSKCLSDFKKHMLKHEKPFKCVQPGCSRTQGFISMNDLNRHLKGVHKLKVDCKTKSYKCASAKCRNPDKEWPRLDNFKQHIIRMHGDEDINNLIARSELKEHTTVSLAIDNTNAFADILGLGLNNTQMGVNTDPRVDGRYEDQLQSLTALITNSIKNSNGGSLEDSVKRALTQAVGTQRSATFQHHQILHPQNHVENGIVNDGQGEGAEDVMDNSEVAKDIDILAGLSKKQRSSSRMCRYCKKILPRACEMNKHVKRHTQPFGCTFHKCNKAFGSKNDWKRHENSQHFQSEIFRCPVTESLKKYGICAKIFYHPAIFEEHLKYFHKIADAELLEDHKKNSRIGRGNHGGFWCGFCKKILPLTEVGVAAWDERFNHIDDHYKEGMRVDHWVDVETNRTKEEMILEAECREAEETA